MLQVPSVKKLLDANATIVTWHLLERLNPCFGLKHSKGTANTVTVFGLLKVAQFTFNNQAGILKVLFIFQTKKKKC
jgi:hypothetical protein